MFKFEDNDNKVFCIKDSNVELSATFETLPKDLDTITIEWTRDGKPITNSEKFKVTKTKNAIQLAIQHVQRDDAGHYTLYAKTDTGETAQKDIELLVEDRSFGDNPPVFLRRLNDLAVKVGTRTRLLVEIRSATDVRVTWYRNDRRICENDRINFVNEGSFYCLEISSITLDDGGKWMCMAENLGGRNSCLATLNVLVPKAYKAPEFVEELRAILTEQGTVSLECKVVGVPTPILRWFKDSKEIKAGDVFALTANPDDLTSLGTYTCEAVNCMGKTYSSSKLHISGKTSRESSLQPSSKLHGPPPIFTSELKSIDSKIGDSITLACQVMVPPWPKTVTWYNKEGKIESSEKYKLIEDGLGSYILEIKPAEYSDEGEWKFVVTSNEGTVSISTCSVHMDIPKNYRKPRFMENLKAILTDEGLVSFECKVVGFPTPLLRWFKDGHELKPGDVYQLTGTNSLGSYSCIARNCMGEACSSAVLTLEDIQNQLNENERIELQQKNQPPKFMKGLMSCDTKINEEFKFTVQIKATTEPVFSWYRDDLPVDKTNERYEITTEKVGFCHLTIKCVEFVDQAEWKCVATNEFGHSTSTCFLKLQIPRHFKKPRFLECLRAVLTEEGAVNLECKVIGVPQPTLRWFKDGVELKPGDIHRIISGKDGECSLGTYTCEARNCMGVVTSSATLLGYEENYKSIPKPEPANLLQRHLSLSTIHEERTSQLYDTPMGDITVDEKGDVSFSFDGKEVSVSLYETPDLTEEEALQIVEMYADQISEHVTEQNIVELPPLRFVKETTQSGNLLMEAVVIDVSPDYFPPEEDMRTEADMEDISVVDAMSQAFEDPLSEQSLSKRRRKEESLKSGEVEEFFSLSQSKQTKPLSVLENYVVEEAHSDEEITETDLQTFESAKSSEKGDSDKQKKVVKSDDSLQEQPPKLPPRKRTADSKSKDEDSVYLQDISGEQGDGLRTQTKKKIDVKTITINKSIIEKVIKTVIIVKQHLIAVENEVIAQSSLMMSPTSGDSSIGIVKSVLGPINAIECKVNDYNGERNVDNLIENLMPDLKSLNHGLSIIEKCVEMDSEGKTLVQRTSVCVIESVGIQMLAFLESLKQVCLHNVQGSLQNESLLIINDMQTGIHITEDTIKSQTLIQEASALEASQRVSETVAQMQQNIPESVPLEVVTTAELPKEANSFKLLCRYILKLQEILETSQQSDVKKETLAEIQKPIKAIQNEIHSIEEKISKNSLKDTIEEKISFKILDTVSPPLYELNKCFEAITKNVESGNKSPKILDPFILPLQEIQTGLALIGHEIDSGFIKKESPIDTEDNQKLIKNVSQNVIYVESNIENIRESTSMTVYDSLIQLKITISSLVEKIVREPMTKGNLQIIWALKIPLEELNYCFRHIEERSTSGSLRDLLDPLNSLKENMEVVEEKLRQLRISNNVDEIIKIKNLVDQCDAEIQLFDIIQLDQQERMNHQRMLEQQLSEHSQHLSEMQQRSVWNQEKCDILTNVQQNIVNIQEVIGFENNKSFSEPLSTLKTLANPLRELSRQIANIREEILLENVNDISINDYKAILKLANPIREICQQLAVITKDSTFESAQVFSSKSDQDSLKSLAVPLAELRDCIAAIQHECISLHEIQGEISHPQISLKTARPLEELRLRVEEIIHNIVEPDEISTTLDDISVMKTMSEMSDEVKVESSQHVVKVTETKVEAAYVEDKKEEKVIEIKHLDVEASDIDEKKSQESQQHVETAEKIEKVAVQKVDETVKVAEQESSKIIEASKQDVFESQEQKFSMEIQTHLLKMKEEMETVMIAVQNMRQPTNEVQTIEKELKSVLYQVSNLPNNLDEMNKIIETIEVAEKSIASRKTSDVILVKYNLESLKKTLKIIIKTVYPDFVEKKEATETIEQKIESTEVQTTESTTKVELISEPIIDVTKDVSASISQAENQVKKMKILIKKISTIPELQAAEQELEIAFENLADIKTNPDKLDKAIEVINVVESKLMAEKSPDLVEIRENFATLKQILIILKSSVNVQQVNVDDIKDQPQKVDLQNVEVHEDLKITESDETETEKAVDKIESAEKLEVVEKTEKIVTANEQKVIETIESKSSVSLESKAAEITESKPLEITETKSLEVTETKSFEIVEIKSEELKIVEEKEPEKTQAVATIENVQPVTTEEIKESVTEQTVVDTKDTTIEELKITEEPATETVIPKVDDTVTNDSTQEAVKEITEVKDSSEPQIQEKSQAATQQILPEIQQFLIATKENIETLTISIKKARRPTDELKAAENELSTILESLMELPENQQQIEKAIEKIEAAETSLVARKTSDIVVVKENLLVLKKSLIALNNSVKAQQPEVKDIKKIPKSVETEIIEIKEELKIVEEQVEAPKVDEIAAKDVKPEEKQPEIIKPVESVPESKEADIKEIKDQSAPSEVKLEPEIQQALSKAKDEIETVTMSIKKVRRTTSELESVQGELNVVLENIAELPENVQKLEKIIESIEKAEASLLARKTSDIVLVKESLSNLKQCLVTLTNAVSSQKVEIIDEKLKAQVADLQIFETSEELKIVESNECIAEKVEQKTEIIDEAIAQKIEDTKVEEPKVEKVDETVAEKVDIKSQETIQQQMTEILPIEEVKLIESTQVTEQKSSESTEIDKCLEKSKEEIQHTIESIHKVRRMTPEIQAIERQLSTTFENVKDIENNEKVIEEILNKIEAVEESIAIRRTSDISDLKGNLTNLKQCLVTLRTVIVQHNAQIQTVQVQPQQAVISVMESKEELQVTEPSEKEMPEVAKVDDKTKTVESSPVVEPVEEKQEQPVVQKVEEIKEPQVEKVSEIPNEINVCLEKTKTKIENVTASVKKVRRPTTELQAAQEELNTVLEKLENLPEDSKQIEKVIESIEKAETSLIAKKTSDNVLVKENLSKLKQSLILLNSAVKAHKVEIKDILQMPQISDLKVIETSEELRIVESNESLAEKVEEKVVKIIEENVTKEVVEEIIETAAIIEKPEPQKEQEKPEETIIETKIVVQEDQKTTESVELQKCLEKSKDEISQTIESIKKVRRSTPEIQAIERQLSTTFENVKDIQSNDKVVEEILSKIEAAEESIKIRKTSDIALLKENFTALKQSLVTLRSVIVQQNASVEPIDVKAQKAELGIIESTDDLKIIEEKSSAEELRIIEDEKIPEVQKSADENKETKSEKVDDAKPKEVKIEDIKPAEVKVEDTRPQEAKVEDVKSEEIKVEDVKQTEVKVEDVKSKEVKIEDSKKIEEPKLEKELTKLSEATTQQIVPEIQECLNKTKENIETVTISIKKARRPTDELQAAEKELTIILENISQLSESQQQIEKVIEKIETAEASLVARKTSDIVLVKENLTSLKQSLVTLVNTIKTQNIKLSTVKELPQIANLQIIEASEELKIVESNESLAEKHEEKITEIATTAEVIKKDTSETQKTEEMVKSEVQENLQEPAVKQTEIKPQDVLLIEQEQKVPEDVNVDFCIKKSKTEIENTMASIKSARRPTPELQATEKTLSLTLEKISELQKDKEQIEKAISSIESAEASLVAKKTSDMVLVKQNLSNLKESFVTLKNTINAQHPKETITEAVKQTADLQIIESLEDLKIVESNENIAAPVLTVEKIIEKSKVEIENTVESIKKARMPTIELQAIEKDLVTALEHLSDLQHDEKKIEKVIESITAAETSLTAKKTSDIVLIKENLSQLKESLSKLKTNAEELKVNNTEAPTVDVKKMELPVIEPSNDLKIVESNEDLTVTDETPKVEELEGLQATEREQLTEVTLSLAKSRDEIENVMFAIRKARHPPPEVNAVEKILTSTYEQLFELPKDEKFIEKAIESIELAEISLVTRGAGDLIIIKNNLGLVKESLIKIISFTNPQKAESLLHELQKPQVAEVSEIQEQKQVKEEEMPQELTSKQKLQTSIEKTVESIRNSRRATPEVQAIEKEFSLSFEKVSNLENDKQEIEKVIELIETAETSLAAKHTSDIVLIKENLALVKETLNTLKLTAQSKPIEIIELKQQKPEQAIIVDEKLKKEELEKEIVDKKSVEKQQEIVELKENEAKLPLQTEIQETQKHQPNENVEKLKTEIVSTIESIKKVRRPNTEIQAVEKELTMVIEHVNELPNDEKKIENVITAIENTEASLVAKRTSDIAIVKNNLSELKQTLNVMKNAAESSKAGDVVEVKVPETAQAKETVVSESIKEVTVEKPEEIQKVESSEKETVKSPDQKPAEELKKEIQVEVTKDVPKVEKTTLPKDLESLKSDIESSIQSIKKTLLPTSELGETEKILSMAFENVSEFSVNVADVQKAIESIIVAEVSLIAKRTSDMIVVKNCLGNLKEKLTVVKNNLKPQKPEIIKVEELTAAQVIEEIPKVEPTKVLDTPKEEPKKVDDKPEVDIKKIDDMPIEEPKKVEEKTQEKLPSELTKIKIEIVDTIDSIKKIRRGTTELSAAENELKTVLEHVKEIPNNQQELLKIISSIENAESSLATRRTSDIMIVKEKLNSLKDSLATFKSVEKIEEVKAEKSTEQAELKDEIKTKEEKIETVVEPKKEEKSSTDKTDKPKEEMKPKEDPKLIENEKPKSDITTTEESPKVEEKPKVLESATIRKLRTEIANVTATIKKVRRPTPELTTAENELTIAIQKLPEFEKDIKEINKSIIIIEKAEDSVITKKTSDILAVKESLSKLKTVLTEIRDSIKPQETPKEKETSNEPEQPQKSQSNEEKSEIKKVDEIQPKEVIPLTDEKEPKEDLKPSEPEKPKEASKSEELIKIVEKPKIPDSPTVRKLRMEIENVSSTIKKVRRPTPELTTAESALTIVIKKLPEFENELEEINKNITIIEKAEDSIITKKTSDMLAVKESLSKLKTVLTEMRNSIKPTVTEKPKETEKVQESKSAEVEIKKVDDAKPKDVITPTDKTEPKEDLKPSEPEKPKEVPKSDELPKVEEKMKEVPKLEEVPKVEEKSKDAPKSEELAKIEEKPKVPESPTVRKLRMEIENVSATIKKVRRPTPELTTTESELTILVKKLSEFENDVAEIDKIIKVIIKTEDSIITKRTSDMIAVKESLLSLKNVLTELSDSKKPKIEKPNEEEKPMVDEKPIIEEIKSEEISEKKPEIEVSVQDKKLDEKPAEIQKSKDDIKSTETAKLQNENEKSESKEQVPEIKLDEISLKIKSEIENVIHSIQKSRRPTPEVQSLEKSLNVILEVKVFSELSKNLKKIEQTLKSINSTESSLATKKTSDMILVKNNISLLKEVLVSCRTKLVPPQEIKAEEKPMKSHEEPPKQDVTRKTETEEPKIPELPKEFEQPSEVILDIHEKDLMFQYIVAIKQDIEEVLVMIKKARRPSTELQTLHEALIDLKPKVDGLAKDPTYFDSVLHIVTKAKTALLTKRTMDMILLREKVTSLESSLALLKSTIVTEINGEFLAAKQKEEKSTVETKIVEKDIDSVKHEVETSEQKKEIIEVAKKVDEEQASVKQIVEDSREKVKPEEISRDQVKTEEIEPQKPIRRRKLDEPAKIDEVKIETKPETVKKEELKPQITLEPEIAPVPTERRRQRQEVSAENQNEIEPVKPSRRRRADELKKEEKSLPRTPETRRKRMPTFIARLKNRSAPENSILKLTCAVSEPEVAARWTKQGMILKDSEKYLIENSNGVLSLEIKNACAQDAGEYFCFVSNSSGEIETSAFVTIFGEDVQPSNTTFTKNLRDTYDQVTNKLIIECNIKTSLDFSNHKIKWYKDDMEIRPSYVTSSGGIPTTYEQEIDENTGRVKLIITYPMNTDCGLYRCCVHDRNSHKVDEISHLVYKIFNPPPHIPLEELEIGEKRNRIVFDNYLSDIYADDTNKSIRLNCKISQCNAQSEIKWYKNNEELPIEDYREKYRFTKSYNRLCLEILHPKLNDAGAYECRVKNQYNETSTKCNVYVNEKVERQRSKTTARESSFIDFSTGTITDKEKAMDFINEIEDSNKILLERSTREIAARIHRSSNLFDTPPSSAASSATERPNFATPLSDRTVTENSLSVKFTCSLLSSECDISWEKNGIPIRPSSKFTQTFADGLAILEIFDVSDDDAGKYSCIASNKFGDNSTSARLKVYSGFKPSVSMPPTVMRQMKESYNLYNDLLTLECRVRGTPKPHIQWMKDGDYVMPGDKYQQTELPDGTCKLIIHSPDPEEDSGTYTCEAECNGCSDSISHNVQYEGSVENQFNRVHRYYHRDPLKPYFKTGLVDTNVPSGGSIALFVESQPNCEAEWYRERWTVDHKPPKRFIFNDGNGFFACVINHATMDEAAKYSCKLSNPYGSSQSTSFIDVINPNQVGKGQKPPIFMTRPQPEIKIRAGDPFSMSFRVQGEPKPRIQWHKGARDITNAGRTIKEVFNDYVRFSIKESKENDSGIYFITARNRHGVDRSFCQVTVKQARTGKKDEKKIEEKVEENVETVDRSEKGRN